MKIFFTIINLSLLFLLLISSLPACVSDGGGADSHWQWSDDNEKLLCSYINDDGSVKESIDAKTDWDKACEHCSCTKTWQSKSGNISQPDQCSVKTNSSTIEPQVLFETDDVETSCTICGCQWKWDKEGSKNECIHTAGFSDSIIERTNSVEDACLKCGGCNWRWNNEKTLCIYSHLPEWDDPEGNYFLDAIPFFADGSSYGLGVVTPGVCDHCTCATYYTASGDIRYTPSDEFAPSESSGEW